MSLIGRSVKRLEDRPLLTGSGRFAADIAVPDMLHMRVVRSPVAFGRLTGLRIAEALAHPGTVAVWTAQDVADIPPIGFGMTPVPGLEPYANRSWRMGTCAMLASRWRRYSPSTPTRPKTSPSSSYRRSSR